MLTLELLQLAWKKTSDRIQAELSNFLVKSETKGYVIGLSGGLDSSTAASLAVHAVGKKKVIGLILPDSRVTPRNDIRDALELARKLGIQTYQVDVSKIISSFSSASRFFEEKAKIANGNLRARIRMCLLYYYANLKNSLVLGTGDRSEILIGYFTKYGDGAADLLPLGDLYKMQVRELARFIGLPSSIVTKPSSPHLWVGHTARDELELDYDVIDLILHGFFDLGLSRQKISGDLGLPTSRVTKLLERTVVSEHKRELPPIITVRNLT